MPSPEDKYSAPKSPSGKEPPAEGAAPPLLSTSLWRAAQPMAAPSQPIHYVDPEHASSPFQSPNSASDGIPALDLTVPSPRWSDETWLSRQTLWRIAAIAALTIVVVLVAIFAYNLVAHGPTTASSSGVKAINTATPNVAATSTTLAAVTDATATVAVPATATFAPTAPPPTATAVPPTATATPRPAIAFDNGFTNPSLMRLNGSASFNGSSLRLTHSNGGEISSAYYTVPTYIGAFTTTFTYQAQKAYADGTTFIVQGESPTALGQGGGSLGFVGISKSVAVLFKFYNEPKYAPIGNETGMGTNGQMPVRSPLKVPLYSGDLLRITIHYDGATLSVTTIDTKTGHSDNQSYHVNIPGIVGASTAYIGFTGATGLNDSTQDIISWHYQS